MPGFFPSSPQPPPPPPPSSPSATHIALAAAAAAARHRLPRPRARRCPALRCLELALITVAHRLKTGPPTLPWIRKWTPAPTQSTGPSSSPLFPSSPAQCMLQCQDPRGPRRSCLHRLSRRQGPVCPFYSSPRSYPQLQMKCVGAEDGQKQCQRCKRANVECATHSVALALCSHLLCRCIFEKHRRGRKPGSK